MNLIKYNPELYPGLHHMAELLEQKSTLLHQAFVDYYYTSNQWCGLFLLMENDGKILGTVGIEKMPFSYGSEKLILGSGNNLFVRNKGVGHGSVLFKKWMECCDYGVVFGGSSDTHRILNKNSWQYFQGIKVYSLNEIQTAYEGEKKWRVAAKWVLRKLPRLSFKTRMLRLPKNVFSDLSVCEEKVYAQDLIPLCSPFRFRFTPSVEYLSWRYATTLPFVRYRIFRILHLYKETVGYVILNQHKNCILISHCDGINPKFIAYGVLLSLEKITREYVKNPEIRLASSHPEMQRIYIRFGFKACSPDRPFAIGSLQRPPHIETDTASWMVNFDWGDNGLRLPFLDQDG